MTTEDRYRDSALIDRIDDGVDPASAEEAAARAPYERLIERVRHLGDEPPPGWRDQLTARRNRERRRRTLIGVGLALAAAAVVAIVVYTGTRARRGDSGAVARIDIIKPDGKHDRGRTATLGDTARLHVRRVRAHTEVRVYLGNEVLARCPGGERCRATAEALDVELVLAQVGLYRVYVFSSDRAIAAPQGNTPDGDAVAARSQGADVDQLDPITVSP